MTYSTRVASHVLQGLIVSLLPVGCVVGALAAGPVSDFLGRKPAVIIGGCLAALSGALHTAAVNLGSVLN